MKGYSCQKSERKRYDQSQGAYYPTYDNEGKAHMLGSYGWGTKSETLKYKTAHPQKGLSMDRTHLKFFDSLKCSKFNGKPAGFNE